jgi:hypothetical protein
MRMNRFLPGLIALLVAGMAHAKFPPLSPEAQAAAAAAKDKAAWGDKLATYQLCLVQDKIAAQYRATKNGAKTPAADVPPCSNPGPYVAAQQAAAQVGVADAKPVPTAGKAVQSAAAKK